MNDSLKYSIRDLNDCGCCEGQKTLTPVTLYNRSGLNAIAYRIENHASFKQSMLSRLSSSDFPALADLKTRDADDFSIALLDAWALVADVLTFYIERTIQESYLRTATERLSILELARLIGYRPHPGVAASTYLAFTMEEAPGDPEKATKRSTIAVGTKVQSTPGPDELPQMYETIEQIEARVEHNVIRPRLTIPQMATKNSHHLLLKGAANDIKPGNRMLIVVGEETTLKTVQKVSVDPENQTTRVDFVRPSIFEKFDPSLIQKQKPSKFPVSGKVTNIKNALEASVIKREILGKDWFQKDLNILTRLKKWPEDNFGRLIKNLRRQREPDGEVKIYVFRQRASVFGYNAQEKVIGYNPVTTEPWARAGDDMGTNIFLDRVYEGTVPDSYLVIKTPGKQTGIFRINQVETVTRTAYGISAQTTVLTLSAGENWWPELVAPSKDTLDLHWGMMASAQSIDDAALYPELRSGMSPANQDAKIVSDPIEMIRSTTVYLQSEPVELAEIPDPDPVAGDELTVDDYYPYFEVDQQVILTGEPVEQPDVIHSVVLRLAEVRLEGGLTKLRFETSLSHGYVRRTVLVFANVAPATHGEFVREILGSGDAGRPYQHFILRQPPLTHVSAETPSGTESTLEIRVDDVRWHEAPSFFERGPDEHIFVTKTNDDGKTTVQFGDGFNGARPSSGQNNVVANYRKGSGFEGLVKARQLDQLMTRPLGVGVVINPIAAGGAADPESRDDARANAPLTVLTLDRIVSLKDYEDFARAFAGIAKAQAIRTWDGMAQRVFITVAGPKDEEVGTGSSTYQNLLGALQKAGDPYVNLTVKSYRPAFFRIEGGFHVQADYMPDKVMADVQDLLRQRFSFEQRHFAQPVMLSEVIALIQTVSGVMAVDIDHLYRVEDETPGLNPRLAAAMPAPDENGEMFGAELLSLDPSPLDGLKVLS